MRIELRRGITLHPGTFTAVIAPQAFVLAALNGNPDLQRFLFLFVCGNYSRLLSGIGRTSANFEVRRPFTADQLLTVLNEAGHTVVFVEHDPTLFDGGSACLPRPPQRSGTRDARRWSSCTPLPWTARLRRWPGRRTG